MPRVTSRGLGARRWLLIAATASIVVSCLLGAVAPAGGRLERSSSMPAAVTGYDMVGSDGGVFVFPTGQSTGFFGSLPGLGVKVNNIVGIVPTNSYQGYDMVGSDGGVFVFPTGQSSGYYGSLPGLGVHPSSSIIGMAPTTNDQGYFLVGTDGGVFSFNAPFENSLPGLGFHVNNIVGIAITPDNQGYWLASANGTVYALGDARNLGSYNASQGYVGIDPNGFVGIAATSDGGGYWLVNKLGGVIPFGDAPNLGGEVNGCGLLPGPCMPPPLTALVPTADDRGYWLITASGAASPFGDAVDYGSLPGMGITNVSNVVGAVPTD